jgi:D-serine deaminase-like pyridoxal phosphate-dependent protein
MLAGCGVPDVLLAYPLVGPNCARMAKLVQAFPATRFSVVADHPAAAKALSAALANTSRPLDVLIDLDVGQHRTGIAPGPDAAKLYETIATLPGLKPGGLHVYDGHNHQESPCDREAAVTQLLEPVLELRDTLLKRGLPVDRIVGGGTPTFPVWARLDLPGLECSPGTCVLHDQGYGGKFTEMTFTPAALLLSRVISRPLPTRLTTDLGYKAVASDPPANQRVTLLNVPDYKTVLQNEEHLVVETPVAERFAPGDEVYAVPTHICPTCALHRHAYVVENGKVTDRWEIVGRDRVLSL